MSATLGEIDLTPTWGEIGKLYVRLAESNELAAIRQMRPEIAKAMAAAQALKDIHGTLSPEQRATVQSTMKAEMLKQGIECIQSRAAIEKATELVKSPIHEDDLASSGAEYLPGATREEIGTVMMQDIVGDYDTPEEVQEWAWIENEATFNHVRNGADGIWEFVLNLSRTFADIPTRLAPVIAEARRKNLAYLVFHQGT